MNEMKRKEIDKNWTAYPMVLLRECTSFHYKSFDVCNPVFLLWSLSFFGSNLNALATSSGSSGRSNSSFSLNGYERTFRSISFQIKQHSSSISPFSLICVVLSE